MATRGLGREETCIVHHDRPAATRCGHCHKPVCSECVTSTKDGKFCSHECAKKMADFRANAKTAKTGGGLMGKLVTVVVIIIVLIIAALAANKYFFKNKDINTAVRDVKKSVKKGARDVKKNVKKGARDVKKSVNESVRDAKEGAAD